MISTAAMIRRHVHAAEPTKIHCTRDVLYCGTRGAVDQEMQRLVQNGTLIRLANGVFARYDHPTKLIHPEEIVQAKATAFGKRVLQDGSEIMAQLNITETPRDKVSFAASGSTTEFNLCLHGMKVQLNGVSARKLALGDTATGALLRAFWQLGRENCSSQLIRDTMQLLNRTEKELLWKFVSLIPAWLKDFIEPVMPRMSIQAMSNTEVLSLETSEITQTKKRAGGVQTALDIRQKQEFEPTETSNQYTQVDKKTRDKVKSKKTQTRRTNTPLNVRSFAEMIFQHTHYFGISPNIVSENTITYMTVLKIPERRYA